MWRMQREDEECADSSRSSIYLGNGMQQQVGGRRGLRRRNSEQEKEEGRSRKGGTGRVAEKGPLINDVRTLHGGGDCPISSR